MLLLLAAFACDPCPRGGPRVDPSLGDEVRSSVLQELTDFVTWSGQPGLCLVSVEAGDRPDCIVREGYGRVSYDPGWTSARIAARTELCWQMVERIDPAAMRPDLFGPDADFDFLESCQRGPWDYQARWRDERLAACGSEQVHPVPAFLLDEVFPHFPDTARDDGRLRARWGDTRLDVTDVWPVGRAGSRVFAYSSTEAGGRRIYEISEAAPRPVFDTAPGSDLRGAMSGADGLVIPVLYDETLDGIHIPADGAPVPLALPDGVPSGPGTVIGDVLWAYDSWPDGELVSIDLWTGERHVFTLPAVQADHVARANDVVRWGDDLVVSVQTWRPDEDDPLHPVQADETAYWRFRPATGEWDRIGTYTTMLPAGVDDRGRILGVVFGNAGYVLAAWDPATDRLLVNDTVCMGDYMGLVTTGDRVWTYAWAGHERDFDTLVPIVLDP